MTEKSLPNRWLIASAGILMQLCLGTLYGWSIFANPLMTKHGWTNPQVTLAFTIAVGIIGLASAVGGYILDNKGARLVATFGGVLFGLGIIITGLGDQMNSLPIIYLGYGVVAGIGLGFAYITPIATLVKWFPDKKGLISGLAVMGFGLGALIMTVLSPGMIASMGTSMTFYIFGAIFLVGVVGGAQWMIEPPAGYVPEGWTPPVKSGAASGMTLGEALASKYFYLLWAMLFVNVTAGMAVVSQAAPMARELLPATMTAAEKAKQAGLILGLFAIFNGVGRLFWASLSDKIGRRTVFTIMFASQAVAFYLLTTVNSITMFIILASYIYLCLGGGFATMPAYAADTYGTKYVGRIYGWKLTAWSAAGVVGPMLFSYIRQSSGNYSQAFFLTSIALAVALILPVLAAPAKEQA